MVMDFFAGIVGLATLAACVISIALLFNDVFEGEENDMEFCESKSNGRA